MRHCTSLRSLSRPPSISASSTFLLPLSSRLPSSDLTGLGPLMLVSRLSLLAPSCCSSEVGRHTSNKIWTAALSWRKTDVYVWEKSTLGRDIFAHFKHHSQERCDVTVLRARVDILCMFTIPELPEVHSLAPPW